MENEACFTYLAADVMREDADLETQRIGYNIIPGGCPAVLIKLNLKAYYQHKRRKNMPSVYLTCLLVFVVNPPPIRHVNR